MLLLKVAYSVEQLFSYAALAFELEGPRKGQEGNPILSRLLHLSIQGIHTVLCDSDTQIQLVGLRVVKNVLQKGIGGEFCSFLNFYFGELVEDFFAVVWKILGKPINREGVAVAEECLKILVLLQTSAEGNVYQKVLIRLLLEAILMIISTSDASLSQEANDLRITAVKLVSQLAQVPSSAAFIKDILLEMPAARRQHLQDIIRASVMQNQNPKPVSSSGPPLVIKMPLQTEQKGENDSLPLGQSPKEESDESSAEEEDDWDTFQSFPASGNENAPTPEIPFISDYTARDGEYEADSASPSPSNRENISNEELKLDQPDEIVSSFTNDVALLNIASEQGGPHNPSENVGPSISSDQVSEELKLDQSEEIVSSSVDDMILPNMASEQVGFQNPSDSVGPSITSDQVNDQSDEVKREEEAPLVESAEMVHSNENNQNVLDVFETTELHGRSDELQTMTSHDNEPGFPNLQSIGLSAEDTEPSRGHHHEESAEIPDHESIIDNGEQERPVVSTNDSEAPSIIKDSDSEHHSMTG